MNIWIYFQTSITINYCIYYNLYLFKIKIKYDQIFKIVIHFVKPADVDLKTDIDVYTY